MEQPTPSAALTCVYPRYELDTSTPYDYMVARMLLDIANKSQGLEFSSVEYASGEVG